jgi:ElaB/YqjD/DUF883 family membrane-anchored ribosome-binding protein
MESNVTKNTKQATQQVSQTASQASDALTDKFKDVAQSVQKRASQIGSDIADQAQSWNVDDLKSRAEEGLDATYELVRKYPLYSLLGAAAFGYLASSLVRGKRA